MIHVVIAMRARLYRDGLQQILNRVQGIAVIGTCTDTTACATTQELAPDVLVLDVSTDSGRVALRDLSAAIPAVPVVVVGIDDSDAARIECAEAGAAGFVMREGTLEELVAAIESAVRGELMCSPRMAHDLARRLASISAHHELSEATRFRLTERESEIARLIGQHLSNKEIASRLGIEVATVKNHVHNLLEKLNVHRRGDAAHLISASGMFAAHAIVRS